MSGEIRKQVEVAKVILEQKCCVGVNCFDNCPAFSGKPSFACHLRNIGKNENMVYPGNVTPEKLQWFADFIEKNENQGAPMSQLLKENALQCEALTACRCEDTLLFIMTYGGTFRSILDGFKARFDRLPTVDELIWCASEVAKHDIREGK